MGAQLISHDGRLLPIDTIHSTLQIATVYNLRVADYHTYFVGCDEWGWSVWAHNTGNGPELAGQTLAKDPQYQLLKQRLRQQAWAGDMDTIIGTMERFARRALLEGGSVWQRAEAALGRYAEVMNNRFRAIGSSKRAVMDATV